MQQQFETNESETEPPRIEYLRVENYRALKSLEIENLTALTVFSGANDSGKSTLFDVFAFLSECFSLGLRRAWDKRGRFRELRTRGGTGPLKFTLKYREKRDSPLVTYYLAISETARGPVLGEEWLEWQPDSEGSPFRFLDFRMGRGLFSRVRFPLKRIRAS